MEAGVLVVEVVIGVADLLSNVRATWKRWRSRKDR